MKTCLDTPTYHYIDTAPLAARYDVICAAIMAFLEAGRLADMLRYSHKVVRLVRLFTKLEAQNSLLKRKLEMLSHKPWRERVLKELGGVRKLELWEAAKAQLENAPRKPVTATPSETPAWLYTPERIAESERLKARVRDCGRATAHPLIFRDHCKMDFEGQFRLAPLPRKPQGARKAKVYTQNTIVDYTWNNIPFATQEGLGPAIVWPAEFYAAMKAEAEILEARIASTSIILHKEQGDAPTTNSVRDDRCDAIPTLPLSEVLSPKVRRDLFTKIILEAPPAFV